MRASPGLWEFAATDLDQGFSVIARLLSLSSAPPAIGAHLAISTLIEDPASGTVVAYGPAPDLARQLQRLAPAGLALASDSLAVTLAARPEPCEASSTCLMRMIWAARITRCFNKPALPADAGQRPAGRPRPV